MLPAWDERHVTQRSNWPEEQHVEHHDLEKPSQLFSSSSVSVSWSLATHVSLGPVVIASFLSFLCNHLTEALFLQLPGMSSF
jgi:hypothetical protein